MDREFPNTYHTIQMTVRTHEDGGTTKEFWLYVDLPSTVDPPSTVRGSGFSGKGVSYENAYRDLMADMTKKQEIVVVPDGN